MKKTVVIGSAVLLLAGGASFAAFGGMTWLDSMGLRGSERQARTRIVGYWEARVANDPVKLAPFVHPSQQTLVSSGPLTTEAFEVQEVVVGGDTAVATVHIRARVRNALVTSGPREVTVKDRWVRHEGQWFKEPGAGTIQDAIKRYQDERTPPGVEAGSSPQG
jgi:hypothetical protein